MFHKSSFISGILLLLAASPALAQVVVTSRPVVTYYAPPATTYYAPVTTTSRVVYDAPIVASRPVTTYYAPLPEAVAVSSYIAPTTTYYAPVTTYYGGTIAAPVYGSPVVISPSTAVGRSAYGTLRAYIPGQPVRNALRFAVP